jgi:hypothetical protein
MAEMSSVKARGIKVSEYLLNNCWVFDAGNDAYIATAFVTGFYVFIPIRYRVRAPKNASIANTGLSITKNI